LSSSTANITFLPTFPICPGCITTGRTVEEIERNIREAIELHLEGLREDGEPIPEPHTAVAYVELQGVA